MELLHRPAALDEAAGEPVEQLGVRGRLAAGAEIVGRGDDAASEMPLPDAIDHHARGQRILLVGDPLRELEAAAALLVGRKLLAAEDREEAAGDRRAERLRLAANHDAGVGGLALGDGVDLLEVRILGVELADAVAILLLGFAALLGGRELDAAGLDVLDASVEAGELGLEALQLGGLVGIERGEAEGVRVDLGAWVQVWRAA